MINEIINTQIKDIQSLINKGATLTDAVSGYFKAAVNDTETQKIILRELSEIHKDKAEELEALEALYPEDVEFDHNPEELEKYLKNYKQDDGYECSIFATGPEKYDKLIFDRGTMNFIGARTSRGKTTAMVSMTVDALLQNKKVLFATFEETGRQIETRLVLNLAYRKLLADERFNKDNADKAENKEFWNGSYSVLSEIQTVNFSPGKIFQSFVRNDWKNADYNPFKKDQKQTHFAEKSMEVLKDVLQEAHKEVKAFLINKNLIIFDGYLTDLQHYLDRLTSIQRGTVIFADYIQKIPTPGINGNRYEGIKRLLKEIDTVVKKKDLICINGAQFGRVDNKTNAKLKDSFTDESFQESSDIEQIGEIEIGIGREPVIKKENDKKGNPLENSSDNEDKPRMFFSILKNRNGENNPALEFDLVDGRKFSYFMANTKIKGHY